MTADFPLGWVDRSKKTTAAPVILVPALILAVFICAFIFGCVAWRRRRRSRQKDLEKKLQKFHVLEDDPQVDIEEKKRSRVQQRRLWIKATARWKPKLSARRRRKRAASISSTGDSSHLASPRIEELSLNELQSTEKFVDDLSTDTTVATTVAQPSLHSPDSAVPDGETSCTEYSASRSSHELPQPPSYRDDGAASEVQSTIADSSPCFTTAGSSLLVTDPGDSSQGAFPADNPVLHLSTAHIATDDKRLLARMATLVSSPLGDAFTAEDPSHEPAATGRPTVPVIEVLEAEPLDVLEASGSGNYKSLGVVWSNSLAPSSSLRPSSSALPVPTYSRQPSPHPALFPAPPSKAQLAASLFHEYPRAFEDVDSGPDLHPSAPPFASPSAPEDDQRLCVDAIPCAPPLIDEEDELQLGLGPSAPPLGTTEEEPREHLGHAAQSFPFLSSPSHPERTVSPPDYLP
jgi:hypothetical protein